MSRKIYYSQKQIKSVVLDLVRQMYQGNWKPDYLVGITRGGLTPALMISHYTGIPMYTLDVRLRDYEEEGQAPEHNLRMSEDVHNANKKILIVDDINDSGATFNWIVNDWELELPSNKIWVNRSNVKFASIVDNLSSDYGGVDYHAVEVNKAEDDVWIVFPWEEWWGVNYLERSN